ncbi:ABC transporter ATP-binding protein [Caballeronia sp. LZ065]|uniref:ABC transporter ATP-binding protein n=1 Tax=Caballeronia sp. LZ065 TaxID=3038571 RepID=UPI0028660AA9|nr:ABC transporter ATP-binding protein [Caballeronia sp. LZ065]MDR5780808.1 ABC transporter ATP-binding protein [Caballeronia sp. LZ065]
MNARDTAVERAAPPVAPALHVENLSVGYGRSLVLDQFSFSVNPGEVLAVVGPNGAGKSTLLKAISGCLRPRSGRVRFGADELTGLSPDRIARLGVLHVPETRDIFGGMTVFENLQVAFDNLNEPSNARHAFDEVFDLFPLLATRRDEAAGNLSGGQQQMLAIARALLGRPRLLMLDEPSLGLARIVFREIYATLERLRRTGLSVLLVEQNASMAVKFADSAIVLVNGEIALRGRRDEIMQNEALVQHYLGGRPDIHATAGDD